LKTDQDADTLEMPRLNDRSLGSRARIAVIAKSEMMEPMLAACPSFRAQWEEFLQEWNSEDDKPLYLALSELARHLIAILAARDTATLSQVFAVVERWHLEGDAFVREAATVGLLEDLQNENLHVSTTAREFEAFLQPESLKWWGKVDRFWSRREIISDD
jgi:hypothetical protein